MISAVQFQKELELIITNAIREDVGDGDHSSLACIPANAQGKAKLLVKDEGVIAGVAFAKMIFNYVDPKLEMEVLITDGEEVKKGDVVYYNRVFNLSCLNNDVSNPIISIITGVFLLLISRICFLKK
jgi:nicotinate-nucleotide pyrophosphorylase (carboxylating)